MSASRWLSAVAALVVVLCADTAGFAQVSVSGHFRGNGTGVAPHHRSRADGNFGNNGSTAGNVNPYPGQPGTQRTPPVGYGGNQLAGYARGFASVPNYALPACNVSRSSMFASASYWPAASSGDGYSDFMYSSSPNSSLSSGGLSPAERERQRRLEMMQKRRDDDKARREKTWAALPDKQWSEEELASKRFSLARQLWLRGLVDDSRRWLEQLVADYPTTTAAENARVTLARF